MTFLRVWAIVSWSLGVVMLGFDGDTSLGLTLAVISLGLVTADAISRRDNGS